MATLSAEIKDKKAIFKIFRYYKKYKGLCLLLFLTGSINIALSFAPIIIIAKIVNFMVQQEYNNIIYLLILLFISALLMYLFQVAYSTVSLKLSNAVEKDIRNAAVKETMNITLTDYYKEGEGPLVTKLSSDTTNLGELGSKFIKSFLIFVQGVVQTSFIILTSPYYLIWVAIESVVLIILMTKRTDMMHQVFHDVLYVGDQTNNFFLNIIQGFKEIKDSNLKKYIRKEAQISAENKTQVNFIKDRKMEDSNILIYQGASSLGIILFWIISVFLMKKGSINLETILIINSYVWGLFSFFTGIVECISHWQVGEKSADRVFGIIDHIDVSAEKFGNKEYNDIKGDIFFDQVEFSYTPDKPLFKNLSIQIEKNSLTSFVGKSGCGKSTILNLISKDYDIQGGSIYIDGHNLATFKESNLRDNISVVSQTPFFFEDTIYNNLKLVNKNATKTEIIEACKKAQIHEVIINKPEQYDTLIGQNNTSMSGGQKQRLAIARALLKKSKIIIFDEATSALDNESQEKIKEIILELKKDHTILMVAHRLSTVVDSDKIVVMGNNGIEAFGTHEELLKNNLEYKCLYELEG